MITLPQDWGKGLKNEKPPKMGGFNHLQTLRLFQSAKRRTSHNDHKIQLNYLRSRISAGDFFNNLCQIIFFDQ